MPFTLPPAILQTIQHGLLNKYFIISAEALLVYDYILMLPAEIEHIWLAKWTVGNVLYILTRYMAFVQTPFIMLYAFNTHFGFSPNAEKLCVRLDFWAIFIACNILYLRTAAIWGWSKKALLYVLVANSITLPISLYSMATSLASIKFVPSPIPTLFPCNVEFGKDTAYLDFVVVILIETCVVALTVCRRLRAWPQNPTPLLRTLYKDALLFFGCLCFVTIINLILYKAPRLKDFYQLLVEMQLALHSLTTSRIILHLRIVSSQPGSNDGSAVLSDDYMKKMAYADSRSGRSDYTSSSTDSDAPYFELEYRGSSMETRPRTRVNKQVVVDPYMI